jgi:hypothetical protein
MRMQWEVSCEVKLFQRYGCRLTKKVAGGKARHRITPRISCDPVRDGAIS